MVEFVQLQTNVLVLQDTRALFAKVISRKFTEISVINNYLGRISDITDLFGSSPFGTAVDYALVGLSVLAAVVLIVLSVGIFLVMRARKNDISDPKEIEMRSEQPPPPPPDVQ